MSRLRDEAIKAAEDKKEEEKKREEEEREKKPGKDGIRVRLKIFTIFIGPESDHWLCLSLTP